MNRYPADYRRRWAMCAIVTGIVILSLFIREYWQGSDDDDQALKIAEAITSKPYNQQTRLADVYTDAWDVVCPLEPYANAEFAIPERVGKEAGELKFKGRAGMVDEDETALAFVQLSTREATVLYFRASEIFEIHGPVCLNREGALFSVSPATQPSNKFVVLRLTN